MKIAMMTNNYKPYIGGVPISIERLSEGLRANGHEVVVFAPSYKEQEAEENVVRYHSVIKGIVNGFSVPNSLDPRIERQFKTGNFDIIHVHHPMLIGQTARYLSRKYDIPLCFTYHTRYEQYLHYIKAPFLENVIPRYVNHYTEGCDLVFAPTQSAGTYLENIGSSTRLAILPTGLNKECFEADEEKTAALRKTLLGKKQYLFCTAARLAKEKNLDFLFRCLALRKEMRGSDFRLAVIGEGPYQKQLLRLAEALGLKEEILFVGKVPNDHMKNYYKAADLFLFSSLSETQGIVLLEAMATATPVLAVKASGVCDLVVNGQNGYMTRLSEIQYENRLDMLLGQDISHLKRGALETARKYEMREIARQAAIHYNRVQRSTRAAKNAAQVLLN